MSNDSSMEFPRCNCLAVRQAARHITQFYDRCLAPAGLRTTQYSILANVDRLAPVAIHTLASELAMDRTTLGRNMLPLERDGLIAIESRVSDRRSKELRLTQAGARRLSAARKYWADAQTCFENAFGSSRAASLRGELRAVVAREF